MTIATTRETPRVLAAFFEDGYHVRVEPNHRRVRVFFGNEAVADSTNVLYLFETNHLPVYYFPRSDVRFDLLEPTGHHARCPYKGDASYYTVVVGDRQASKSGLGVPRADCGRTDISDYVAFYWDLADSWYEEDEEVFRQPGTLTSGLTSSSHPGTSASL